MVMKGGNGVDRCGWVKRCVSECRQLCKSLKGLWLCAEGVMRGIVVWHLVGRIRSWAIRSSLKEGADARLLKREGSVELDIKPARHACELPPSSFRFMYINALACFCRPACTSTWLLADRWVGVGTSSGVHSHALSKGSCC
ncbi:hypothetical protein TRVL_09659 [Trypanosoma vivax]|nr:hypothetical protein TRVL_09659 [Trypanosoma vivax]